MEYAAKLDMQGRRRCASSSAATSPSRRPPRRRRVDAEHGDVQVGHCREMYVPLAQPEGGECRVEGVAAARAGEGLGLLRVRPAGGDARAGRGAQGEGDVHADRRALVRREGAVQGAAQPQARRPRAQGLRTRAQGRGGAASANYLSSPCCPTPATASGPTSTRRRRRGRAAVVATAPFELINGETERERSWCTASALGRAVRDRGGHPARGRRLRRRRDAMPPRNPEDPAWPELIEAHEALAAAADAARRRRRRRRRRGGGGGGRGGRRRGAADAAAADGRGRPVRRRTPPTAPPRWARLSRRVRRRRRGRGAGLCSRARGSPA